MIEQTLKEIALNSIRPNPLNPRKNFADKPFEEMVHSIREKGVISPILVRPVKEGKIKYEIIFGERRYRASCQVAKENGGLAKHRIPVLVRDLDDSEAFDLMTIENLQRQDLTELEEARSFKYYLDRNGEESAVTLAEKIGISTAYIRRRVAVLSLPRYILKAWDKGILKYGHLEALSRLSDKAFIKSLYKDIVRDHFNQYVEPVTVAELRDRIASRSPLLDSALFDAKQAGCFTCPQNSDVQKTLFAIEAEDRKCNHQPCFREKQFRAIMENWQDFAARHELPTTGFKFVEEVSYTDYNMIANWEPSPDQCRTCDRFLSIIHLSGSVRYQKACFGDSACYARAKKEVRKEVNVNTGQPKAKDRRVDWHGEYFRELFYQDTLPVKIREQNGTDAKVARLTLFSLLKSNRDLHPWFAARFQLRQEKEIDKWTYLNDGELFSTIAAMEPDTIGETTRAAVTEVVMQQSFGADARRFVADHIGIDLSAEWYPTEEYFKKKTKAEILEYGEKFGIFDDERIRCFMEEQMGKPVGRINSCKKGELMRLFLESGVDLVGKVPEEVTAS